MLLSVIITNYNTKDLLIDCIANLLKELPSQSEIIVVDNASTDGSADAANTTYEKKVKVIGLPKNMGLAYANNRGFEVAKGSYVLYLGTDAFPKKEAFEALLAFMDTCAETGVVTPKLVKRDGSLDMDAHRGFPTPWVAFTHFVGLGGLFPETKMFNYYFMGHKDMSSPHEIDMCISHFMLVRRKVVGDVKGWDENFFVYGEDVDFCYRVKKMGWKIMYLPKIKVLHYKGAGVGRKDSKDIVNASSSSKETRIKMRKESVRAMRLFYTKHLSKKYSFVINWFMYRSFDLMGLLRRLTA